MSQLKLYLLNYFLPAQLRTLYKRNSSDGKLPLCSVFTHQVLREDSENEGFKEYVLQSAQQNFP